MAELRIEYSEKTKGSLFLYWFRKLLKWVAALGIMVCPVVNYLTGGPAWSVVAICALIFLWKEFLSPDVLENNSIRQVFRLGSFAIIETMLIGICLSPGWIGFVLPIIGFGTLILSVLFFLINLDRHRNSIMPLIIEILMAQVAFLVVYLVTGKLNWPMITLGSLSVILAIVGLIAFHKDIWTELKKRFHTR